MAAASRHQLPALRLDRYADQSTAARVHTSLLVRRVSVDAPARTPRLRKSGSVATLHSWDYNPFEEVRGL